MPQVLLRFKPAIICAVCPHPLPSPAGVTHRRHSPYLEPSMTNEPGHERTHLPQPAVGVFIPCKLGMHMSRVKEACM